MLLKLECLGQGRFVASCKLLCLPWQWTVHGPVRCAMQASVSL